MTDRWERISPRFVFLGLILVLAAALRFYNLTSRGLVYWDEGKFALEGVRMSAIIAAHGGALSPLAGKAVGTAKPTHALILGLAYLVLGVHDYSPLLVDAACSLGAVALLYPIGVRLIGPSGALVACLLMAVSEYDLIYARSVLSESDADLLFLGGVLCLVAGREPVRSRYMYLSGLFLGLAFTTNYRMSVYIAALGVLTAAYAVRHHMVGTALRVLPLWLAGLATAPVAWQCVDWLAWAQGVALFRSELTAGHEWYWQEVLFQLHEGKQAAIHIAPLPYLQWYWVRQGPLDSACLLAGIVVSLGTRTWQRLLPAGLVLLPWAVYSFAPFIVPRNMDPALPFTALLSALALSTAAQYVRGRAGLAMLAVIAALVALGGVTQSWRLTALRSGFVQAARYVEERGGVALVSNEVMAYYLRSSGTCDAVAIPRTIRPLASEVAGGFRFAEMDRYNDPVTAFLNRRARLVARFPVTGNLGIGEDLVASENTYPPDDQHRPEFVTIYNLSLLFHRGARPAHPSCNPARVV